MRISKCTIKEFKRFKNFTIDLGNNPARIVALVGPNGCGKSSVFDAFLEKLSYFNGRIGKDQGFRNYEGTSKIFYREIEDPYNQINIDFFDDETNKVLNISDLLNKESFKTNPKKIFSFRSPYRYSTDLQVREIKATKPIEDNSYGASSSIMLDKRMEENYRNLFAYYHRYLNNNDKRPSEAKKDVLGMLNDSIKNCLDIEISSLGNVEANQGTLFFKKLGSDQEFEFDCLSAGEKEVVDLLLDLFLRAEKYPDSIFLFDEPELHINTSIQRKLLKEIEKMVGKDGQIWIATHSIGFLRALQDDFSENSQVIKFSSEYGFDSETIILKPMQKNRYEWMSIFETALDDLAGLISPKRIIYCEGRDKPDSRGNERGMDAKVLNNIFNKEYPDTLFVSSGGNTELEQRSDIAIAILNKAMPDLDIWVFKDRDIASGKSVSEEDRLETLKLGNDNLRIMKRWEIENYLFDKEVLNKYCEETGKVFNEQKYDNLTQDKNIMNGDYKDLGKEMVKVCGINTNINQDKFKEDLSRYITSNMEVYKELKECIFDRK